MVLLLLEHRLAFFDDGYEPLVLLEVLDERPEPLRVLFDLLNRFCFDFLAG